jgi:uncharacterized protein (TIGR03083 family)
MPSPSQISKEHDVVSHRRHPIAQLDQGDVYEVTTANRLMIADVLEGLSEEQWSAETLCPGWNVHTMAAHLLQPMLVGFGRFLVTALRYGGDTDRTVDHVTRRLAQRSRVEILTTLREHAGDAVSPPRVGPMGPFAETCIHLRDIARPLDLRVDVPTAHWEFLLRYLVAPGAAVALVPAGRLDGLHLQATGATRQSIATGVVSGPPEALVMAAAGRRDALAQLAGPGVKTLSSRIA